MGFMKKLFKGLLVFVCVCAVGIGAFLGYEHYQKEQRKEAELTYLTDAEWKWHDEYDRIQIRFSDTNQKWVMRKVHLNDSYAIYAAVNDDYSISVAAMFDEKCTPNTEIETSQKWKDGSAKVLKCHSSGKKLIFSARFYDPDRLNFTWAANLDGFSFYENFSGWNLDYLDKKITLSKARLVPDTEAK